LEFKDTQKHSLKDITNPQKRTQQMFWIKSKGKLGDALALHQCVVAYGSDHNLLGTVPLAHGATWFSRGSSNSRITMMASLDHSMWFHCPFRADEWMLYVCERYGHIFIDATPDEFSFPSTFTHVHDSPSNF
jgi:acyl-CoA thioesterase II